MNKLTPNNSQLKDHFDNVKTVLQNRIRQVLSARGINKRNPARKIPISTRLISFFNFLLNDTNLERFLNYDLTETRRFLELTIKRWPETCDKDEFDYQILYNVFVDHAYGKLKKAKFIEGFNLKTCPYCNRQYIYKVQKNRLVKPEIDHFFPKNRYPVLAVSFYNLIPSCQPCNGFSGKGATDSFVVGLKSPYEIENEDFIFTYDIKRLDKRNPLTDSKIEVKLAKKIDVNSDLFNLEELYKKHDDHVAELIFKSKKKYAIKYRNFLKSLKLGLSDSEIDRMLLSTYTEENEVTKRPLSKLYQDIGKELGLI